MSIGYEWYCGMSYLPFLPRQWAAIEKVLSIVAVLWKNLLGSCKEDGLRLVAGTREDGSQRDEHSARHHGGIQRQVKHGL